MGTTAGEGPARLRDVIAIDGPAGVGKSTTARAVARRLGLRMLDSGALYRALALAIPDPPASGPGLAALLEAHDMEIEPAREDFRVRIDGRDVTGELRAAGVDERASRLATLPEVREFVGRKLRDAARRAACVAEGRDMGTAVFPEATLKVFLTAGVEARALRRRDQLRAKGVAAETGEVREGIERRDARDRGRAVSPLRRAPDAVVIDNTEISFAEQVDLIVSLYRGGGRHPGPVAYRAIQWILWRLYRLLLNGRVAGGEKLPKGAFLLASNHKSYFDPLILGAAVPGMIGYLAKEELFRLPGVGASLRGLGAVPIRRGKSDRRAVKETLSLLARGYPMVVFPEGTRIRGEGLGEPQPGIALLARRSGVPVLPARIWGSDGFWSALLRRRPVWVVFGEPLDAPAGGGGEGTAAARIFAARVMQAIENLRPPADR